MLRNLQLAANCRVDLSDSGSAFEQAQTSGADENMMPFFAKDTLKAAADALSDIASQLADGQLDADVVPK